MERTQELIDEFGCRVLFETKQDYLDYIRDNELDSENVIRCTFCKSTDNNDDFIYGEPSRYPCVMWSTVECKTCGTKDGIKDIIMFQGEYIYENYYINYFRSI